MRQHRNPRITSTMDAQPDLFDIPQARPTSTTDEGELVFTSADLVTIEDA